MDSVAGPMSDNQENMSNERCDNGDNSAAIEDIDLTSYYDDDDLDEQDVIVRGHGDAFDTVIGHIEDIFMEETFQDLQSQFMEKYWQEFENSDENKFSYTFIFKEYAEVVEKHIERYLVNAIPNFSMDSFVHQLQQRKDQLEGEVFEMLFTFSDFVAFKEMFLDYKAVKEGTVEDLGKHISVTSVS